jgi:diadenosine tetraphosphate (Ap4A) HIT family hydrolase
MMTTGPGAAQVVPHVHFHIIPRMEEAPMRPRSWTMFGRGTREDLDFDEAEVLVKKLREQTKEEIEAAFANGSRI